MIKVLYTTIFIIFCALVLFLVHDALIPFILASILSYLIHPIVKFCSCKWNISRSVVVTVSVVFLVCACVMLVFWITPLLYAQAQMLISKMQVYKQYIQDHIPMVLEKANHLNPDLANKVRDALQGYTNDIISVVVSWVNNLWGYTMATLNIVLLFLLVPLISFYMLKDWPSVQLPFAELLSEDIKLLIKRITREIDQLLSAYIRGQLNICCILSIYYSVGLWLIGYEFAILIGIMTSFAIIIPFVGFLVSFCIALIISYLSFGISTNMMYVIVLYLCGSLLEGSILTPKIIGDKIGIHPLWIIFSILVCSKFFGVLGMICAIPFIGICKILGNIFIDTYFFSKHKLVQ